MGADRLDIHTLPDEWKLLPLGEVADYLNGRAFKKHEWEESGDPIIRIQNLNDSSASFNYTTAMFEERYRVRDGDLLFAWAASLGAFIWRRGNAWLNQHIFKVEPRPFIEKEFLYYTFLYLIASFYAESHGSGMVHITKKRFEAIRVGVPALVEQRAIVGKIEALFSELDQGVAQLEAARAQLKRYRQAVLKDAFEGKLTADWREEQQKAGRQLPTADDLLDQIKAERAARYEQQLADWKQAVTDWEAQGGKTSGQKKPRKPAKPKDLPPLRQDELADLPELPEGWAWAYLATLGELARGKSRHRPRNAPHLYGGPYPFIQTGEVKAANRIVRDYTQTYSDAGLAQSRMWQKGTLCITIAANIAETAFLGFDGCFPDSIVGFTASDPLAEPNYVEFFFQSAKQRISAFAPATAQKNINLTTLENIVVPYCSLKEQCFLVAELKSLFSVLDQLEQSIDEALSQAEALRQSILKKAFEGRLLSESELAAVRADPDYEPAEKLLERIRAERAQVEDAKPTRGRKPKAAQSTRQIKLPPGERYRQAAYAAYAVKRLSHLPTFGRVQQMKFLYLVPHLIQRKSHIHAERRAAGPLDPAIHKIESLAKKNGWFTARKSGKRVVYTPDKKIDVAYTKAVENFGDHKPKVDWLLGQFVKFDTERAELLATTFAVWNDYLIDGHEPSEDEIVRGVHGWHPEKAAKFDAARIGRCIKWMHDNDMVPTGMGPKTQVTEGKK